MKIGTDLWISPIAYTAGRTVTPAASKPEEKGESTGSLSDKFWSSVNHLATKPVQFYFRHGSNNVKPSEADLKLGRFGAPEVKEILERVRPGDLILFGDKTSFVHGSVYIGNGEIVHALAARAPQGTNNGVVREKLENYINRVERERVLILRRKDATPADIADIVNFARKQVGKDYDFLFRTGKTDAFYCTEFAWMASRQGQHSPRIEPHKALFGLKKLVTTDDIRHSPDLIEIWGKNVPPVGDKPVLGLS